MVVDPVFQSIGKVLLVNPAVWVVVGVEVELALDRLVLPVEVLVLELAGDRAGAAGFQVGFRLVDRVVGGIGFGGGGDQDHRVGQRDPCLWQAHLHRDVTGRPDDRDDLRIGKPHVLAGADHQPPAGRDQVPRLQKAGQVVDGGVGVGAPHRLLVGGDDVVMLVPVPVIAHRAPLGKFLRPLHRHLPPARLGPVGRQGQHLDRIERLPHVPAAGPGDMCFHFGGNLNRDAQFRFHRRKPPVDRFFYLGRLDRLELEDGAAGEHRPVDVEIGVFGGGGDQGDPAVLDILQQRLLLLFVEVLDLVEVEDDPFVAGNRPEVVDHRLDIGN